MRARTSAFGKRSRSRQRTYALVLEDDVWFERDFGRIFDQAWREMEDADRTRPAFDVLYVSYREVRYGAPKELISRNVFRPERGLWFLSGYVLSKKGAQALLGHLPCRGPSTSGSITSSESWTFERCAAQ